jgi:ABC-type polysaccharide/polyol phosphate transport system ATPase subunit
MFFTLAAYIRRIGYYKSMPLKKSDVSKSEPIVQNPNMGDNKTIRVNNVGMRFKLSKEKVDNLKEFVIKFLKRQISYKEFWAIKNITFEVEKGDRWGIIGLNGAGKSTLLKIISGVMKPTEGSVEIKGKIVPLLELGAGFDGNYTGKENIFLNGAMLGFSKEFLEEKYDEIVEFSEVGKFIDVPLKNYSSGMRARLGFSIATSIKPEILVLDEVLSVGDAKFKKKSENKILSLFSEGVTVLFVSHSIMQVKRICNKAIWLEKGEVVMMGDAKEVCEAYEKICKSESV